MLDEGLDEQGRTRVYIGVWCTYCRGGRELDIVALAARLGREYSLVNRRCRCRLQDGCPGWNRFNWAYGRHTWTRHLIDPFAPPPWY